MPSAELLEISNEIENSTNDSFVQFYMYLALLNVIAVGKGTYKDALPKHIDNVADFSAWSTGLFKPAQQLTHKELDEPFIRRIAKYQEQYVTVVPDSIQVIQKICLSYFRRGQLSDLIFIIEKICIKLQVSPMADKNKNIYEHIKFESNEYSGMATRLLQKLQKVTTKSQSVVDHSMNALIGTVTSVAALVAILSISLSLAAIVVVASIAGISAYLIYLNCEIALADYKNIFEAKKDTADAVFEIMKIFGEKSQFFDPNYKEFMINKLVLPLLCTSFLVKEQIAFDDDDYENIQKERNSLDDLCREYSLG